MFGLLLRFPREPAAVFKVRKDYRALSQQTTIETGQLPAEAFLSQMVVWQEKKTGDPISLDPPTHFEREVVAIPSVLEVGTVMLWAAWDIFGDQSRSTTSVQKISGGKRRQLCQGHVHPPSC